MERLTDEELFTSPMTFMGAPYGRPGPGNKAAILGIPFDCGTNMRIGARGGPDSVRQQSALMRRFNPTHNSATQFTHIAEEGLVDPQFSWHVGIRSTTYAQGVVPRALGLGYKVVSLDELVRGGFAQRVAEFRDHVGQRPVYLCFDMDVFDPSCAPGVCTPSWGGLSAREGIDLLRCLTDLNIVAVDVNTVSPPQDVNGMAAHLCAHVIYEALVLLCRQMGLDR